MTTADLRELFIRSLVRDVGGTRGRWGTVIGQPRLYSAETHPHCNWMITPSGTSHENSQVERLADDLRQRHPIIAA